MKKTINLEMLTCSQMTCLDFLLLVWKLMDVGCVNCGIYGKKKIKRGII